MGPQELELLSQIPLFAGLSREQLALLLADASVRRFPAGTMIFMQDEPATQTRGLAVIIPDISALARFGDGVDQTTRRPHSG